MSDLDYAIDAYDADLARRGMSQATRFKYRQILDQLAGRHERKGPGDITTDDCRDFLAEWTRPRPPRKGTRNPRPPASPSTLALHDSIVRGLFTFLHEEDLIDENPMARVKRPRRKRPEDLDVVTISGGDVLRLINACDGLDELLCIATLAYLGPRRSAASGLRRHDLDLDAGRARFKEKGGKVITKPIPIPLLELYREADDMGTWLDPRDWVIPNRRSSDRNLESRSPKVIYAIVTRVAGRARVRAHPHTLRAAFAVQFDEQHPDQVIALKELLGHARLETTQVYLRRKNKALAMEQVRDLDFALPALKGMPPAGFEPRVTTQTSTGATPAETGSAPAGYAPEGAHQAVTTAPELLRLKAREYELTAEHWAELHEIRTAEDARAIACALLEVAAALDHADHEAAA